MLVNSGCCCQPGDDDIDICLVAVCCYRVGFRELVLGPYAILSGEIRCVGKLLVRIIHLVSFGRDLRYRFLAIATQSARVRTLETMPSMERNQNID